MPLTNIAIKAAKPQAKPYKLFDEKGLFLLIEPSGGQLWRLKYRLSGKEKKLAIGRYPEIGLKEARDKRDEARTLLATGVDPGQKRKTEKLAQAVQAANTFQAVAEEYIAKREREGFPRKYTRSAKVRFSPKQSFDPGQFNGCFAPKANIAPSASICLNTG